jgi:hypothetical protein
MPNTVAAAVTFSTRPTLPSSQDTANNKALSQISQTAARNGAFKLSNGIIVQWGIKLLASNEPYEDIYFPTPFNTPFFSVAAQLVPVRYYMNEMAETYGDPIAYASGSPPGVQVAKMENDFAKFRVRAPNLISFASGSGMDLRTAVSWMAIGF